MKYKCSICGKPVKPPNRKYCSKTCQRKRVIEWNKKNRERKQANDRHWAEKNRKKIAERMMTRNHGVSLEEYEARIQQQGNKCGICGGTKISGRLKYRLFVVDHCHTTGKIRGLLCNNCNRGLGQFLDNPKLLRLAAEYLETRNHHSRRKVVTDSKIVPLNSTT